MCVKELLSELEIKDMQVRFYMNIFIGTKTVDLVKFMTTYYEVSNIPRALLLSRYDKYEIENNLIRIYL